MSFNKNLDGFLTGCRESALEELKSNGEYAGWKSTQTNLRSELDTLISPEARRVLEAYLESVTDVQRLEYNTILLCGLTVSAELHRRFDPSTDEYKAFEAEYL